MLVKARAILLKKINYGEKNLILQTYSLEEGSQSFFVGGSQLKGKNKTVLPPMAVLDVVANQGKGDLLRIKESRLYRKHLNLISNIHKSTILVFINEVLIKTLREYDCDPDLFGFIVESLDHLNDTTESTSNFHLKFMLELSKYLGFSPSGTYSEVTPYFNLYEGLFSKVELGSEGSIGPPLSQNFDTLLKCEMQDTAALKLSRTERRQLLNAIIDYFRAHIDGFGQLKSLEVLEAVLI